MFHKLRRRVQDEKGFTLIELLVVILIIGILAAIAIPSFLNQKSKATDASAKELARTAQTTAETYATDHGTYSGISNTVLAGIEPTIQTTATNGNAYLSVATSPATAGTGPNSAGTSYTVTAVSASNNTFSISRADNGILSRTCTPTTTGSSSGGCVNGTW